MQYVRLDDAKQNYARRSARERWFKIGSVLPDGSIVRPCDFEPSDPDVVARALSSVGVHKRFDIARQRSLAALNACDGTARAQQALRDLIVANMQSDEMDRAEMARIVADQRKVGETTARNEITAAVPEGRSRAVTATTDAREFRLWRESRSGKNQKWIIRREETGQVVLSDEAERLDIGGLFG